MANSPSGQSVIERFLRILEAFDRRHSTLSLSVLARRADLPISTAHRLVGEMVDVGALRRSDGGLQIGVRMWELGYRGSELQTLREAALPSMLDVQHIVGQHTNLAIRDNDHVLYLERLSALESTTSIAQTATRLPLSLTSSGLVLIAFGSESEQDEFLSREHPQATGRSPSSPEELKRHLSEIRRAGYCVAQGYTVSVSTGVAVPVFHPRGAVMAALGVIVPRGEVQGDSLVPTLLLAARSITRALATA